MDDHNDNDNNNKKNKDDKPDFTVVVGQIIFPNAYVFEIQVGILAILSSSSSVNPPTMLLQPLTLLHVPSHCSNPHAKWNMFSMYAYEFLAMFFLLSGLFLVLLWMRNIIFINHYNHCHIVYLLHFHHFHHHLHDCFDKNHYHSFLHYILIIVMVLVVLLFSCFGFVLYVVVVFIVGACCH